MLKSWRWGGLVAHKILVSAPVPLELIWAFGPGFDWAGPRGLGRRVWDLGLTTDFLLPKAPKKQFKYPSESSYLNVWSACPLLPNESKTFRKL